MNAKTAKAIRKAVRSEARDGVAPALGMVTEYAKSTEDRVKALELSVGAHIRMFRRGFWGRLSWLVLGR